MSNFSNLNGRPVVLALCDIIEENKTYLSKIDGAIGDGDHGINMAKGFRLVQERLAEKEISLSKGCGLIGQILMTEIGGSMGPIYGTFFIQMSLKSKDKTETDTQLFAEMLKAARVGVEDIGGAKVGDKTIMDTLVPAEEAYQEAVNRGADLQTALTQMAVAAEAGKESTRELVAKLGRASRLGERSRGILDAGATSCVLILQTFQKALS